MQDGDGGSLGSLREHNRARVVDALRRRGLASRSDLARMTGLSRTTVGTLVADLQERGLVVEEAENGHRSQTGRGRPPVFLRFEPSVGIAVGIDFDHDRIRIALADLSSTILGEDYMEIDVDRSAADAIDAAVTMLDALRRDAGVDEAQIVGVGVGLAGPIDRRTGAVASPLILPGWAGLDAEHELTQRLGLHVEVENDANLGALAEVSFGAGRGMSDIVYVRVGSGVGAGLVIGGRLHHGVAGLAGELGHVHVSPEGVVCRCGNRGCLETVAAEWALGALLRPARGRDLTAREILDLVEVGDPGATRVVADAGRAIGSVLAALCNVLNPEAIIVGGEMSEAGEALLGGIREAVDRLALPGTSDAVEILHAELGERAEVLGALALVIGNTERLRSVGLAAFAPPAATTPQAGRGRPVGRKEEVHAGST